MTLTAESPAATLMMFSNTQNNISRAVSDGVHTSTGLNKSKVKSESATMFIEAANANVNCNSSTTDLKQLLTRTVERQQMEESEIMNTQICTTNFKRSPCDNEEDSSTHHDLNAMQQVAVRAAAMVSAAVSRKLGFSIESIVGGDETTTNNTTENSSTCLKRKSPVNFHNEQFHNKEEHEQKTASMRFEAVIKAAAAAAISNMATTANNINSSIDNTAVTDQISDDLSNSVKKVKENPKKVKDENDVKFRPAAQSSPVSRHPINSTSDVEHTNSGDHPFSHLNISALYPMFLPNNNNNNTNIPNDVLDMTSKLDKATTEMTSTQNQQNLLTTSLLSAAMANAAAASGLPPGLVGLAGGFPAAINYFEYLTTLRTLQERAASASSNMTSEQQHLLHGHSSKDVSSEDNSKRSESNEDSDEMKSVISRPNSASPLTSEHGHDKDFNGGSMKSNHQNQYMLTPPRSVPSKTTRSSFDCQSSTSPTPNTLRFQSNIHQHDRDENESKTSSSSPDQLKPTLQVFPNPFAALGLPVPPQHATDYSSFNQFMQHPPSSKETTTNNSDTHRSSDSPKNGLDASSRISPAVSIGNNGHLNNSDEYCNGSGGHKSSQAQSTTPLPAALPPREYPLYPWFLSRNRFPGGPPHLPEFLLPFRKPKRIRTAFSPSQLLKLEHAFEKNQYVVGAERKDLAKHLCLSETQVKVWFQNRRTKHKREQQEGGGPTNDGNCGGEEMRHPPSSLAGGAHNHRHLDGKRFSNDYSLTTYEEYEGEEMEEDDEEEIDCGS